MSHPVSTPYSQGSSTDLYREVSRLLSAAVISARFRQLLLSDPAKALEIGYAGECFHFPREAKRRVASIQAASLADFADQVHRGMDSLALASWSGD